ncbi:anti-sigma F factor [Anaerosinus massiliensis]|uniref:anti-sigma F factor n=1 Tax=Massilibacillus massiliensis TaxID=1806837 RepID=UPI000A602872|nr:anti-sigma F factor [Massilibacillus massiliensis]
MQIKNQIKISLQSLGENIGLTRVAAAAFASQANLTLPEIEEIKVAISEAVSNSVIHAYEKKEEIIDLIMNLYADRMEFIIRDYGKGIADIKEARKPSYSSDPERMGLGFAFMESFMDSLDIKSEIGKGTTVKMIKNISNQDIH